MPGRVNQVSSFLLQSDLCNYNKERLLTALTVQEHHYIETNKAIILGMTSDDV